MTITTERIQQLSHAATNAINAYHGGDTSLHITANELCALCNMALAHRSHLYQLQLDHDKRLAEKRARRTLDGDT